MKTRIMIDSDFTKKIASLAIVKPRIIAEKVMDAKELAKQSAISYWMMGWNWDEIESILEDSEYAENVIAYALKEAKQYAKDTLVNGPFSVYKSGQFIKLTNGDIGTVKDIRAEYVVADINGDEIQLTAEQVDAESSKLFTNAYNIREAATKVLAQTEKVTLPSESWSMTSPVSPSTTKQIEKTPGIKGPEKTQIPKFDVKPSPEEKFEYKPLKKTPSGLPEAVPQMSEVEQVGDLVAGAMDKLDALEAKKDEVDTELKELTAWTKELRAKKSQMDSDQLKLAQEAYAVLSTQQNVMNTLDTIFFRRTGEKFLALQQIVTSTPIVAVSDKDRLAAVTEMLQTNFPQVYDQISAKLDDWEKENTILKEQITKIFSTFPISKEKRSNLKTSQMLTKMKDWVSGLWNSVKEFANELKTTILPDWNSSLDVIDELVQSVSREEVTAALNRLSRQ